METPFGFTARRYIWKIVIREATPYILDLGERQGFNKFVEEDPQGIVGRLGFDVCWALLFGDWEHNWYKCRRKQGWRRYKLESLHTQEQWEEKKKQYNYRCFYCGGKVERLTRDHVIPLTKGGTDRIENIVPACWPCNRAKGVKPLERFKNGATLKVL